MLIIMMLYLYGSNQIMMIVRCQVSWLFSVYVIADLKE